MDIDILTKVKYVSLTGETTGVISEQDICLRVPVIAKVQNVKGSKGGSFVIASLPMVVPLDEKADAKGFSGYSGAEISRTEKEELKPVLESFFKSYYEGTDSEISYYVSEGANIKSSLAGAFLFNRIEQLSISLDEAENVYLAEAKISILDHGQQIDQRIFLRLEKEKDKYYIKRMTTRPL